MTGVAIIARIVKVTYLGPTYRKAYVLEPVTQLGRCDLHPKTVWFEGHDCPCCVLMREWDFSEVPK
jgi:hypothetical protein